MKVLFVKKWHIKVMGKTYIVLKISMIAFSIRFHSRSNGVRRRRIKRHIWFFALNFIQFLQNKMYGIYKTTYYLPFNVNIHKMFSFISKISGSQTLSFFLYSATISSLVLMNVLNITPKVYIKLFMFLLH